MRYPISSIFKYDPGTGERHSHSILVETMLMSLNSKTLQTINF